MAVRILIGDVLAMLAAMPDESVDCVVTSPPYWALRDYGVEGQIGLEPSLGAHLHVMVLVFREIRRVLKKQGTVWLNYGDTYATKPNGRSAKDTKAAGNDDRTYRDKPMDTTGAIYAPQTEKSARKRQGKSGNLANGHGKATPGGRVVALGGYDPNYATSRGIFRGSETGHTGYGPQKVEHGGRAVAGGILKPKDLCMIPNRLAIALQEDGWWVRSEIIWQKPNPMPDSSGKWRPSTAHEKIFMLSKSATCYYDADAVAMPVSDNTHARVARGGDGSARANGGTRAERPMKAVVKQKAPVDRGKRSLLGNTTTNYRQRPADPRHDGCENHVELDQFVDSETRYLRNCEDAPLQVWSIGSEPFSDQLCLKCRAYFNPTDARRLKKRTIEVDGKEYKYPICSSCGSHDDWLSHFATFPAELVERCVVAGCPAGGVVLDPFGGAGTTGLVADRLQREAILIELNPDYAELARHRLNSDVGRMFGEVVKEGVTTFEMFPETVEAAG